MKRMNQFPLKGWAKEPAIVGRKKQKQFIKRIRPAAANRANTERANINRANTERVNIRERKVSCYLVLLRDILHLSIMRDTP